MAREGIKKLIEKAIKELQKPERGEAKRRVKKSEAHRQAKKLPKFDIPEIDLKHPEERIHGDYATNVAMVIAKQIGKNPLEMANILSLKLKAQSLKLFEKIEAVSPGFINFFLSEEYLQKEVEKILKEGEKFGQLKIGKNKKIQVEFISANPTGPLTIGNARGGFTGDVLSNVFKKVGFKTEKAYYINDYGMQVLTLGHSVLKDNQAKYKGDYIDQLNKKIKEKDPYKAGEKAARIIIDRIIKKTVLKMGIKFDEWISETRLHKSKRVDKAISILKNKKLVYEKEGAQWFKSSQFGDQRDRVIIKQDGWKTYLAGDAGLHYYKFTEKKFAKVINIWGADHYGDIPGLQALVQALGHKGKLDIILLQFVTLLKGGKELRMSKRAGVYVTMDELLEMVGLDVARFFFLQKSGSTHLNFDVDLAKEQSAKNPVYYVQYAHARICSILRKTKIKKGNKFTGVNLLHHPSELELIKQLIRFPEIIEDTVKDYQVQRLPQYAVDLATSFHQFYRDCQVLTEARPLQEARTGLILATKIVLKNTLDLMGISAPEKM
ncbi:MAG: arginine--tRNA ligase [bacterium]|nr:arginine--tRNA ligase [bacterium]